MFVILAPTEHLRCQQKINVHKKLITIQRVVMRLLEHSKLTL